MIAGASQLSLKRQSLTGVTTMQMCDLGQGFHLVPLAESNVPNVMHPRRQMSRAFRGECLPMRLPMRQCAYIASNCDPMAIQATMILRDVLRSFFNGEYEAGETDA